MMIVVMVVVVEVFMVVVVVVMVVVVVVMMMMRLIQEPRIAFSSEGLKKNRYAFISWGVRSYASQASL